MVKKQQIVQKKFAYKFLNQGLKAEKKLLKVLKSKNVFKKIFLSVVESKLLFKMFKPAVYSNKVTEKSLNHGGWKQTNYLISLRQRLKAKTFLWKIISLWLKSKSCRKL